MNRTTLTSIVGVLLLPILSCGSGPNKASAKQVHATVANHIEELVTWIEHDFQQSLDNNKHLDSIKSSFFRGRTLYKKPEFAVEYFFGNSARQINGPPLPEIEADEHIVIEPGGFQVMEEILFSDDFDIDALRRESRKMKSILRRVETLWRETELRDDQVFDALRMQCFRTMSLGLSGFDTPASNASISEVPISLNAVRNILEKYGLDENDQLWKIITRAIRFASTKSDFNSFDRLAFIAEHLNPLTSALMEFQVNRSIKVLNGVYGINGNIKTLFDKNAFNADYFSPDKNSHASAGKISLGKQLFFDPIISGNKKISCASCHIPEKAFTDAMVKNKTFSGNGVLKRNTPTLLNAGLQKGQFYDMRAMFLEDQVRSVIENKDEIHGNLQQSADDLNQNAEYSRMFKRVFNSPPSERNIQVALAAYIRSLITLDSRFDRFMRGDRTVLNTQEKTGFNLFMGKAKCGACHFLPLFNGTVPPAFTFTESEVIGVPADKGGTRIDSDSGRYHVYAIPNFLNAFKTPTIRNIELTAPYMHNGVYKTLEEVMNFYNRGGGKGLGFEVPNQTLPFDSLQLNTAEQQQVIAFLKSLTDVDRTYQ